MDKLASSCFVQHGAPSRSLKLYGQRPSTSLLTSSRRSVSILRCAAAAKETSVDDINGGDGFDFERYLSANARVVHDALDVALWGLRCPASLSASMRHSILAGGKRIRPVLAIAACELVGGAATAATPVACAVEMIHTASFIHDDMSCMDGDALRRGRPSNHVVFGEATTLLAGDVLLALVFEHVARGCTAAGVPADRTLRAVLELGGAARVLTLTNDHFQAST